MRLPVAPRGPAGVGPERLTACPLPLDRRGTLVVERPRAFFGAGNFGMVVAAGHEFWSRGAGALQSAEFQRELVVDAPGQAPPGSAKSLPTVVVLGADRDASYGAVRRTLAEARNGASPGSAWSFCGVANHEPRV